MIMRSYGSHIFLFKILANSKQNQNILLKSERENMANIKNKNELKRRIDIFLHDFTSEEYAINEEYCKETMRMIADFIDHVDCRLTTAEKRLRKAKNGERELAKYIIANIHSCPIPVEVICNVGFQSKGCVKCLIKNTDLLKREKEDN